MLESNRAKGSFFEKEIQERPDEEDLIRQEGEQKIKIGNSQNYQYEDEDDSEE